VFTTRNLFCGLLAYVLLKTGKARRALQRAFSGDVITAVYFHKPSRELFAKSIGWLIQNGYHLISVDELTDILHQRRPFPKGAAWISLDDGYREWLDDLLPVIREYKVPVTLFIPTGIVAGDGRFPWIPDDLGDCDKAARQNGAPAKPVRRSLTVGELQEMAKYPEVRVGGHTVSHAVTVNCTSEQLQFEIGECKRALEQWTGTSVSSFAYPEGRWDGRERQPLSQSRFSVAATTVPSFIRSDTDPLLVPRFCVPDNVTMPEAVCNMVGIWHPVLQPIKTLLGLGKSQD
jgi:peptidoglycan/xylan/chitin deacetylase (PgdA/CDA1 family)